MIRPLRDNVVAAADGSAWLVRAAAGGLDGPGALGERPAPSATGVAGRLDALESVGPRSPTSVPAGAGFFRPPRRRLDDARGCGGAGAFDSPSGWTASWLGGLVGAPVRLERAERRRRDLGLASCPLAGAVGFAVLEASRPASAGVDWAADGAVALASAGAVEWTGELADGLADGLPDRLLRRRLRLVEVFFSASPVLAGGAG